MVLLKPTRQPNILRADCLSLCSLDLKRLVIKGLQKSITFFFIETGIEFSPSLKIYNMSSI